MKNNKMKKDIIARPTSFLIVGECPTSRYPRDLDMVLGRLPGIIICLLCN